MIPENYDIKLTIPGEPRYQKRHRSTMRVYANRGILVKTNRGRETLYRKEDFWIMNYDPSFQDKKDIRCLSESMAPKPLLDGPLRVDVVLYYQHLKGHYGTGKNTGKLKASAPTRKWTKPDRDNADKIYLDALEGLFWKNDSIICAGEILKLYAQIPRTEIYVTKLVENIEQVKQESLFERS